MSDTTAGLLIGLLGVVSLLMHRYWLQSIIDVQRRLGRSLSERHIRWLGILCYIASVTSLILGVLLLVGIIHTGTKT
jgi:hypothetical protein